MQISNRIDNLNSFQKKNDNKKDNKAGTGLLAYMGGTAVKNSIILGYGCTINNKVASLLPQIVPDKSANIGDALEQAMIKSNLKNKGIELIDIAKLSNKTIIDSNGNVKILNVPSQIVNIIHENLLKNPLTKHIASSNNPVIKNTMQELYIRLAKIFERGANAAYFPNSNKILLNSEKIGYSGFHEIGHAMNKEFSKVGKVLQKMRIPSTFLVGTLSMIALLTNKRSENNPPKTAWQKTKNFIKENVGKLSALAFIPIITEELMASAKGKKLAKNILPKKFIKNITKSNTIGVLTYIGTALAYGFAAFAGNKVRDKIVDKKVQKQLQN